MDTSESRPNTVTITRISDPINPINWISVNGKIFFPIDAYHTLKNLQEISNNIYREDGYRRYVFVCTISEDIVRNISVVKKSGRFEIETWYYNDDNNKEKVDFISDKNSLLFVFGEVINIIKYLTNENNQDITQIDYHPKNYSNGTYNNVEINVEDTVSVSYNFF